VLDSGAHALDDDPPRGAPDERFRLGFLEERFNGRNRPQQLMFGRRHAQGFFERSER
jgi:hypothetical protein